MMIQSKTMTLFAAVLLPLALLFLTPTASAVEKEKVNTVVTVGEMCGGCVKRITKRFATEKEVAKVACSIEKKSVTLVPAKGVRLSPKRVWEILDSIGKTPKKMVSPDGTFTSKPKK
ncbi:cation transporter [Fuerstiella marisgermanici]|uniref:HMA domain-containing protein n=1 Tax=Fuerstiella marisgermanici TaxID=1891926 RepID=A0A1P8WF80_9PLAN|nr:cation transporter [Fuerstiella marisgermanici]APZ92734.1 hypothetical protein Fuma_02346 [Fuerstiella marisgermanici]